MNGLYLCLGCRTAQPIGTSTETVVRTRWDVWVAVVTCNDCSHCRYVPVSDGEAAVLLYWLEVDRGRSVVAEAEQIVKEHARE